MGIAEIIYPEPSPHPYFSDGRTMGQRWKGLATSQWTFRLNPWLLLWKPLQPQPRVKCSPLTWIWNLTGCVGPWPPQGSS